MRKYYIIFKNTVQASLAYRFNTFTMFLSESAALVIMLYLWAAIYRQGGRIGAYSLAGLAAYFIFSRLIAVVSLYDDTARKMNEDINEGRAISYFLKPLNYLHREISYKAGVVAYRLVLCSIVFILIALLSGRLSAGSVIGELSTVFFFMIALFIGITIQFLIFFIVGSLTFFLDYIWGLNFVIMNFSSFFSGNIIPLDLFPKSLSFLTGLLPFKFIVFIPISIATHKISASQLPPVILSGLAWMLGLYLIARFALYRGLKKYEAYGG
jgi:ABC-2 type transport system permease protein